MLRELLDALTDLVVVVGADGRVREVGAAAQAFLGERAGCGTPLQELAEILVPGSGSWLRNELPAALTRDGQCRCGVGLLDRSGQSVPHALWARPTAEGGLVLVARDAAEARAREAAEHESRAKDDFVARLGHELRTPLNAVLGFAQLLELEPLSPQQREDVGRILSGGRHMQSLLDDVLDLARVQAGGVDLDVGPVQVLEVVQGVVELVEPLAGRRGICRVVHPATPVAALADRRRLWQVLLNLVGNALKYGRDGGTVRVGITHVQGGRVRIEVEDDGMGIPRDALSRLFRPFDRLGAERTGIEGSGLGLPLSRALVTAMGGVLTATSRPGIGTLFAVVLDVVGAEAEEVPSATASGRVVFVSADQAARALVAQALRSRLGAETVAVSGVADAVASVRRSPPSLVLADGDLPDAPVADLLEHLAADPLTALVPVVVLSADSDPRERLRLRAAGASAVLDVPLDLRALLEVAGDHLLSG